MENLRKIGTVNLTDPSGNDFELEIYIDSNSERDSPETVHVINISNGREHQETIAIAPLVSQAVQQAIHQILEEYGLSQYKLIDLCKNHFTADMIEEIMEFLPESERRDSIEFLSEDSCKTILDNLRQYKSEGLTIQGESIQNINL